MGASHDGIGIGRGYLSRDLAQRAARLREGSTGCERRIESTSATIRSRANDRGNALKTHLSGAGPVRPALKPAMPAGAAAGQNKRADRRIQTNESAGPVYYGTIEYGKLLLNVFSTPEGWRVAVTKSAYPFREIHATVDAIMDTAVENAKRWAEQAESRGPTYQ
jgi:hypothetical protein